MISRNNDESLVVLAVKKLLKVAVFDSKYLNRGIFYSFVALESRSLSNLENLNFSNFEQSTGECDFHVRELDSKHRFFNVFYSNISINLMKKF